MSRVLRTLSLPVVVLAACGGEPKPGPPADSTPPTAELKPKLEKVRITCAPGQTSNGGKDSLKVDRDSVYLALGDSVEWKTTGNVRSIQIALKQPGIWPFADSIPPKGDSTAVAGNARTPGTYAYKIDLECKYQGQWLKRTIDPDLIITGTRMSPDDAAPQGPGGPAPAIKQ